MATFKCPKCKERCAVSQKKSSKGTKVTCSACGSSFVVKGVKRKGKGKGKGRSKSKLVEVKEPEQQHTEQQNPEQQAKGDVASDATLPGGPISGAETEIGTPSAVTPKPSLAREATGEQISGSPDEEEGGHISTKVIPGFKILSLLGQGGMGAVYKAQQLSLDRIVALKILAKRLSTIPDFVKRFENEAKALATLNHPNITAIFDRGVAKNYCYFAMEYVAGQTLAQLLARAKPTPAKSVNIFLEICDAVSFSHEKGIIHRDLKPGNILLTNSGRVKVTDFGLAGMVGERAGASITRTNMVMGTVNYMAPEQRRDAKSVDHRADIYSMGVILYEMLTGHLPLGHFEMPSAALNGDVSARMDEIVLKALSFAKEQRYETVAHFAQDLRQISSDLKNAVPLTTTKTVISEQAESDADPTAIPGAEASSPTMADGGAAPIAGAATVVGLPEGTVTDNVDTTIPQGQLGGSATVVEGAGSQVHEGVTVVQDGPLSLPPVEVQQVERAAGRVFLIVLALLFLLIGLPALLPEELVPAPVLSMRREVAEWLTGAEAAKRSKMLQRRMSNARAFFRERKWQETVDELDACLIPENPHLLEARYMSGKSLAEWGAAGGPEGGPDRNILQEALLRLKEIDDELETTRRYPDLLYYRARVLHLLGLVDEAEELYRSCIARQLSEQPARIEYSLLLKEQKRFSEAITVVSTGIATYDKQSVNRMLPVVVATYDSYENNKTKNGDWAQLASLAKSITNNSWAPKEYAYIAALAGYFSMKEDGQELAPLHKLVAGQVPISQLLSRYHGRCLYLISHEYERRGKDVSAVKSYEDYIAWAERSNQARSRELSKSRYSLGSLLVNVLRSRYKEAAEHLRKVAVEDRDSLDYYYLALGAALFRATWSRDQPLIPPSLPSKEMDERLKEADKVFHLTLEPFAQKAEENIEKRKDGNSVWRPLLNSMRALALISMARWRFDEALHRWQGLADRVAALRAKGFDYSDHHNEANLSLAYLYCDIPKLRSLDNFKKHCLLLTKDAKKGRTANAYWYCRTVAAYLKKSSADSIANCLNKINGDFGSSSFFAGIVKSERARERVNLLEEAAKYFRGIVGRPSYWAVEAHCELGELALRKAKHMPQGKKQEVLLDEAKTQFEKYLSHTNVSQEARAKSGLERIDVMKAEMKGLKDMSIAQLQQALKYVEVSNRRTAIVGLLSKKLVKANKSKAAEKLLVTELAKDDANHILQSELALLVSKNRESKKERAVSLLTKAWQLCLAAQEGVSDEVVSALKRFTAQEGALDAAAIWEKLLSFNPAQEQVLGALALRLEELSDYGRIVKAFSLAHQVKENDLALHYNLLSWKFKEAKRLLLEDDEIAGRQLIDEVIKGCALAQSNKGQDVITKARFLLLQGRAHRELRIRYREGTHLPEAIKAYTAAVDTLGQVNDVLGLSIAAEAHLDLAEVFVDAERQDFGVKYLKHAVDDLEKLVELDKGKNEEHIRRYRQSVTNLVWSLNNTGKHDEAIKLAGAALSKVPVGDVPLAILFGVLALRRRPFAFSPPEKEIAALALRSLERAVGTDPADKRVRLLLVEAYLAASKLDAAHRELEQVEKLIKDELAEFSEDDMLDEVDEKRGAQIALLRGRVEAARGHVDEAEKAFDEVLQKSYHQWDARFHLALLNHQLASARSTNISSAVAALVALADEENLNLAQRCQLADLHVLDDNPQEALRILGRSSTYGAIEYRRAVAAYAAEKYSHSLATLAPLAEEAQKGPIAGVPSLSVIKRFQALAALQLGDRKAAQGHLQRALTLSADDFWTNYHLARLAAEKRHWTLAEKHIAPALKERTDFSTAYLASAIALGNDDKELAWRRVQLAINNSPNEALGHFLAGHIAFLSKRGRSKAASFYVQAAKLAPKWGRPWEELGLLYLDEPKRAEESFQKILAQDGELSTRGSLGLGLALALQEKDQEAITYLLEATVDDDIQKIAAHNLAKVLKRMKLDDEAKKWFAFAGADSGPDGSEASTQPGSDRSDESSSSSTKTTPTYDW